MSALLNLLGKEARGQWIVPINYNTLQKLEGAVQKAVDSTYMHIKGDNITINFGLTSMSPTDVTDNILSGLNIALAKLSDSKYSNIHSIYVKMSDSPALPIYNRVAIAIAESNKEAADSIVKSSKTKVY